MTTTYDQSTVTYDQSSLTYQGLPTQFDGVSFAVEMAFGYEPLDDDPSWESVTPYVRGFDINRGRNSEFTTYGPGTVSIALDNRDRRFDPEYTSGPYFGQLNPMVPVRVQATYSGTTYTMFYGFVQGWPTVYNQSNTDAVATVTAIDATRLLGNTLLQVNDYRDAVVAQNPLVYYPMQERDTASAPYVQPSGASLTWTWVQNNTAADIRYPTTEPVALGGSFSVSNVSAYSWRTLMFWCDLSGNLEVGGGMDSGSTTVGFTLVSGSGTSTIFIEYVVSGTKYSTTVNPSLNLLSSWHFVVFTFDTSAHTYALIVDNVTVSSGSVPVAGGAYIPTPNTFLFPPSARRISHVATFAVGASSLDVAGLWTLGSQGYAGELSSARLERALDDGGWPSSWRDVETGVQPVGEYRPLDALVSGYVTQIDNAEQGALFVNREGDVELRSRTTADGVSPVGLFDDSGTDLPFANVTVDAHTVDAIRNSVVVQYATDSVVREDAGSVVAYGRSQQSLDARLINDRSDAESIGDTLLARAKDPRTRITRLDVNVRRDPAGIVPVVAALDLSDDVTVSLTPTGVGSALWRAVRVQGITHRVTPQSWDVSLYLAPGPINTNGPLMILDDGTYGVLDSNKLG